MKRYAVVGVLALSLLVLLSCQASFPVVLKPATILPDWTRYASPYTGLSFAYPPSWRLTIAQEQPSAERAPGYTLYAPADIFAGGNIVYIGYADFEMADGQDFQHWAAMYHDVEQMHGPFAKSLAASERLMVTGPDGVRRAVVHQTLNDASGTTHRFYVAHGRTVLLLTGETTDAYAPAMARALRAIVATVQFAPDAPTTLAGLRGTQGNWPVLMPTSTPTDGPTPTPYCDLVCRDATSVHIYLTLTPHSPTPTLNAAQSAEATAQAENYLRWQQAEMTRVAPLTPSPTATPTPMPAPQPGFALYQGENAYPIHDPAQRFQVAYDTARWHLVWSEWGVGTALEHRHISDCTFILQAGPKGIGGPLVREWARFGGYDWNVVLEHSSQRVSYSTGSAGYNFYLMELELPEGVAQETVQACRADAEAVLATFTLFEGEGALSDTGAESVYLPRVETGYRPDTELVSLTRVGDYGPCNLFFAPTGDRYLCWLWEQDEWWLGSPMAGGMQRRLLKGEYHAQWYSDDPYIIYTPAVALGDTTPQPVYLMDVDNGVTEEIGQTTWGNYIQVTLSGYAAFLDADGLNIFHPVRGRQHIALVNDALGNGLYPNTAASWPFELSPDGRNLALVVRDNEPPNGLMLVALNLENRQWSVITRQLNFDHRVFKPYAWSPDGRWLAHGFTPEDTRLPELWLSSADGSEQRLLWSEKQANDWGWFKFVYWLPHNDDILLVRESTGTNPNRGAQFQVIDAKGGEPVTLFSNGHVPQIVDQGWGLLLLRQFGEENVVRDEGYWLAELRSGLEPPPPYRAGRLDVVREERISGDDDDHTFGPVWSPDGSRILFTKLTRWPQESYGIWVADADGGNPRFVANGFYPAWTPRGDGLVYLLHRDELVTEVWLADLTNSCCVPMRKVADVDTFPAQFVDEETLAVVQDGRIVLVSVATGARIRDTGIPLQRPTAMGVTAGFEISPDRTRLLHWSPVGLRVALLADGELTLITDAVHDGNGMDWSPNSDEVAWIQSNGPDSELWAASADGTDKRLLASATQRHWFTPFWSPDGQVVGFTNCSTGSSVEPYCELWLVNRDGTGLTQLTHNSGGENVPTWSPDGTHIGFTRGVWYGLGHDHSEVWVAEVGVTDAAP